MILNEISDFCEHLQCFDIFVLSNWVIVVLLILCVFIFHLHFCDSDSSILWNIDEGWFEYHRQFCWIFEEDMMLRYPLGGVVEPPMTEPYLSVCRITWVERAVWAEDRFSRGSSGFMFASDCAVRLRTQHPRLRWVFHGGNAGSASRAPTSIPLSGRRECREHPLSEGFYVFFFFFCNPVGILGTTVDAPQPEGTFPITDEYLAFLHFRLISASAII